MWAMSASIPPLRYETKATNNIEDLLLTAIDFESELHDCKYKSQFNSDVLSENLNFHLQWKMLKYQCKLQIGK